MTIPAEYLKWRFWAAIFLPTLLAYGVSYYTFGMTLLADLVALSFCLTVGLCFSRRMARAQTIADLEADVLRFQAEFRDLTEGLKRLPIAEQEKYAEPLYQMEFKIRVLESVLESRK